MLAPKTKAHTRHVREELVLLLLASLACVALAAAGLLFGTGSVTVPPEVMLSLPIAGFLAFGLLAVLLARRSSRVWWTGLDAAKPEVMEARAKLAVADALVKAEPQIFILWEKGCPPRVVVHSLSPVPGVPQDEAEVLLFGQWLEPSSVAALQAGLDELFRCGKPFSLTLKAIDGDHLEGDGRAAGGRAVLRFRDLASHKRELIDILGLHTRMKRDVEVHRALLNSLSQPVWIRNSAGRLAWVNTAYVKAVEAAGEAEVIERQIELLDSRQRQAVDRALARGQTYRKRVQITVGGERRLHEVVAFACEETVAAVAADLSTLEVAKGERDQHSLLDGRTLDRITTAIAIFDRNQKLTFFNEAYLDLWKIDAAWLENGPTNGTVLDRLRDLGRLPEVVDYRAWKAGVLSCYSAGADQEDRWHLPGGRILRVRAELRPDGGVTFLYDDETERLSLESRFNALISVQRETLNSLKEGVAVFATDGRLELYNSAFAAIWGLTSAEIGGKPHIGDIVRLCRPLFDDAAAWAKIGRAVTTFSDERGGFEGQMLRTDGSVVDYTATPLPDGATLLTFADVTASRRYERALVERNEALVLADRLKSQFIGHVSYELRTPLTNIMGFGELLSSPRTGPLTPKQREYLSDIVSSSRLLLSIIDDILDLASIDAGALELKLRAVDVRLVAESALQAVRERAARARVTIETTIAEDARSFEADEARVRQVLYNLLSNAIGFSSAGNRVRLACWREKGNMVFSVEDEGAGISKEFQQRVLDRFERGGLGLKPRGAGLGLSIVKSLVELHGGSMDLTSEPGQGTRVVVRFPEAGVKRTSAAANGEGGRRERRSPRAGQDAA